MRWLQGALWTRWSGWASGCGAAGKGAWLAAQPEGLTNPHQHSPTLINGQPFGLDEFVLEGLKLVIVQAELHFEAR